MLRSSKRTIWIVAIVLGSMLLVPCALYYWVVVVVQHWVPFPNGYGCYVHERDNEASISLNDEGMYRTARRFKKDDSYVVPIVGSNVDGYLVYPGFITGHVSKTSSEREDDGRSEKEAKYTPGYFVIDTKADKLYNGLSKDKWLERLRVLGVDHEPKLIKPSIFDVYWGRNKPHPLSD